MIFITLLALSLLAINAAAFRIVGRPSFKTSQIVAMKLSNAEDIIKASFFAAISSPLVAHADGGAASAVAFPLGISVLVMVPFLYYQQ